MKLVLIREGAWLTLNLVAAAVFLWLSSKAWAEPAIWNSTVTPGGDPAGFSLLMVKGLGPLMLFNLAWLACALWRGFPRRDWTSLWTFAGLGFLWTGLIIFSASKVGS